MMSKERATENDHGEADEDFSVTVEGTKTLWLYLYRLSKPPNTTTTTTNSATKPSQTTKPTNAAHVRRTQPTRRRRVSFSNNMTLEREINALCSDIIQYRVNKTNQSREMRWTTIAQQQRFNRPGTYSSQQPGKLSSLLV